MKANIKQIDLLKMELEEVKKQMLLAVIFFDGENRDKINFYKEKRRKIEEMIEELSNK